MDIRDITINQLSLMKHAIGFDRSKTTGTKHRVLHCYRNYFEAGEKDDSDWKQLVKLGLATNCGTCYFVSHTGFKLIAEVCGFKKVVEVD